MPRTLFYREPRLAALAVMVLIAAGVSAFLTIGRQEDPTITNLYATVVTPWPGADPARVEALVTEKIEEELREIAEIDTIRSTSATGVSTISIELSSFIDGARIDQAWSAIRDALSDAEAKLPAGALPPDFNNDRTGAYTAISAIVPRHDGVPPSILARTAEALQDRLRAVPGTRLAETFGAPQEEVLVTLDPVRLAALGLDAARVAAAIGGADAKVSAGRLRGAGGDMLIEVSGEIESLQRIRDIPLASSAGGFVTRIGDVAQVEKTERLPAASLARVDGRRAVMVAARMEDDRQVDAWMARVRAELAEFERDLPAGLEHRLLFDQSEYTARRLAEVGLNMAIGVAIVVAVLLLTLGLRAALVVAAVLPLVTLASVATLGWLGVSINAAIIIMTALQADVRAMAGDRERMAEIVLGASRHIVSTTVTTFGGFLPLILGGGGFWPPFAVAVAGGVLLSSVVSFWFTPPMFALVMRKTAAGEGRAAKERAENIFAAPIAG